LKYEMKDLLAALDTHITLLKEYKLYDVIIANLMQQVLCYMDEIVFNQLLDLKQLTYTDGVNIKMRITDLENWWSERCASFKDKYFLEDNPLARTSVMRYVHEATSLLVVEKEKIESESFITATFTYLKPVQILRILEIYKPDKVAKKQVPSSVFKLLQNLVKTNLIKTGSSNEINNNNNMNGSNSSYNNNNSNSAGALYVNYARKFHITG